MIKNNRDKCCYCGACVSVCPAMALELDETRIKYYKDRCINCRACVKICPVGAMEYIKE